MTEDRLHRPSGGRRDNGRIIVTAILKVIRGAESITERIGDKMEYERMEKVTV